MCRDAANLPASPSVAQISDFLQAHLDVYSLRSAEGSSDGLITGYYEPVYPGSLKPTQTANVPIYSVPADLVVVNLDSIYPELKGKRLRGRLEGRILKPYDTAETINSKGLNAPVLAWLTDPMDLQFLQIQGSGRVQLDDGQPADGFAIDVNRAQQGVIAQPKKGTYSSSRLSTWLNG